MKEKLATAENTLRDKEKAISSLSMYRHHAIHAKEQAKFLEIEGGLCKSCRKRKKDEEEASLKNSIKG